MILIRLTSNHNRLHKHRSIIINILDLYKHSDVIVNYIVFSCGEEIKILPWN